MADPLPGGTWIDGTLTGSAGADRLVGTTQAEAVAGLDGDDEIAGGGGADSLFGGAGDDVFALGGPDGGDDIFQARVYGGEGEDVVRVFAGARLGVGAGFEGVEALVGDDVVLRLDGDRGRVFDFSGFQRIEGVTVRVSQSAEQWVIGSAGADVFDVTKGRWNTIEGGAGDDLVVGMINGFLGGEGHDVLRLREGEDLDLSERLTLRSVEAVELQGGDVRVDRTGRVDLAEMGVSGAARIVYVREYGATRNVDLWTTDADELIEVGFSTPRANGRQTLHGRGGNDEIDGGDGRDRLFGGGGDDLLHYDLNQKRPEVYDGGAGFDTLLIGKGEGLDLQARVRGIEALASQGDKVQLWGRGALDLRGFEDVSGLGRLVGMRYDQTVHGSAGADWIDGRGGDDLLFGGGGGDMLRGDAEADRLYGGEGDDVLRGGAEADRLFGGAGDDVLDPGGGAGVVDGGAGLDVLQIGRKPLHLGLTIRSVERLDVGATLTVAGDGEFDLRDWTLTGEAPERYVGTRGVAVIRGGGGDETYVTSRDGGRYLGRGGDDVFVVQGQRPSRGYVLDGGDGRDTLKVGSLNGRTEIRDIERLEGYGPRSDVRVHGDGVLDLSGVRETTEMRRFVLDDGDALVFIGTRDDDVIEAGLGAAVAGGDGDDRIIAANLNVMAGGRGADRFELAYAHGDDYLGHWRIVDFKSGVDTLKISGGFHLASSLSPPRSLVIREDLILADRHGDRRWDLKIELPGAGLIDPDDLIL